MPTQNYGWPKLEEGSAGYPQTHSALVDQIDAELKRVEQQSGGGGGGVGPNTTIVTDSGELRTAFDTLSDGEHIHIVREPGAPPLEITDYLRIDSSDILVTGEGKRPLITVPDGANTGGFLIGLQNHCERVVVRGISYDGNGRNQTMNEGGVGIQTGDVQELAIIGCDIRETAPWHEHNQNNSGITTSDQTRYYRLVGNHFENIGDRAMEANGSFGWVVGNTSKDGFDRMVTTEFAGTRSDGYALVIANNRLHNNARGSMFGVGNYNDTAGKILIANNIATGKHRTFVRAHRSAGEGLHIIGNVGHGGLNMAVMAESSDTSVVGNHFTDYDDGGVKMINKGNYIANNYIYSCGEEAIWCGPSSAYGGPSGVGGDDTIIQGNYLRHNARKSGTRAEIKIEQDRCWVLNNTTKDIRSGVTFFDNPAGQDSLFAWNVAPLGTTLFDRKQSSTRTQANLN